MEDADWTQGPPTEPGLYLIRNQMRATSAYMARMDLHGVLTMVDPGNFNGIEISTDGKWWKHSQIKKVGDHNGFVL